MKTDLAIRATAARLSLWRGPPGPRSGPAMRELAIIADGGMRVRDGRIVAVGTRAEIEKAAPRTPRSSMPVDASFCPALLTLTRIRSSRATAPPNLNARVEGATYAEIAASGGGIRSTVRQTREATDDDLLAAGRRYSDWFLRGGTTTVEAKSGYGLSTRGRNQDPADHSPAQRRRASALRAYFSGRARSARRISRPHRRTTSIW